MNQRAVRALVFILDKDERENENENEKKDTCADDAPKEQTAESAECSLPSANATQSPEGQVVELVTSVTSLHQVACPKPQSQMHEGMEISSLLELLRKELIQIFDHITLRNSLRRSQQRRKGNVCAYRPSRPTITHGAPFTPLLTRQRQDMLTSMLLCADKTLGGTRLPYPKNRSCCAIGLNHSKTGSGAESNQPSDILIQGKSNIECRRTRPLQRLAQVLRTIDIPEKEEPNQRIRKRKSRTHKSRGTKAAKPVGAKENPCAQAFKLKATKRTKERKKPSTQDSKTSIVKAAEEKQSPSQSSKAKAAGRHEEEKRSTRNNYEPNADLLAIDHLLFIDMSQQEMISQES